MISKDHLAAGKLEDALRSLQDKIRAQPDILEPRIELFDLLCLTGQWDRAAKQLSTIAQLDKSCAMLETVFGALLKAEAERAKVFAGVALPMIFGEPLEWMAPCLHGARLLIQGQFSAARDLLKAARPHIPAASGTWNGAPLQKLEDADPRIGPFLEVFINGRYFWLPFIHLQSVECKAPASYRDVCWLPALVTLTNEGELPAFIPSRYAGSERSTDPEIVLARAVEWTRPNAEGPQIPLGQRVFTDGANDFPLFTLRKAQLTAPTPTSHVAGSSI